MFFVIPYTIPGDFLELSAEVGLSLAVPQLGVEAWGICPVFWWILKHHQEIWEMMNEFSTFGK